VLKRTWEGATSVQVAVSPTTGDSAVVVDGQARGPRRVRHHAADREWRVAADGFWQVHPAAADVLSEAVLDALGPQPGEHAVDLYSGVGLFAGVVGAAVGVTGRVDAVEGSGGAVKDARRNLHDLGWVRLHEGDVRRWLATGGTKRCDLVVLDPPSAGAGAEVVRRIVRLGPRAVAYVACDPAALARDLKAFDELGWELSALRAFDLFPMTHHVECVATLASAG
jgi:tRNA/tmRNA/rRNA uracil-C5-methylase (TrmA/RlmC/RlmD family)